MFLIHDNSGNRHLWHFHAMQMILLHSVELDDSAAISIQDGAGSFRFMRVAKLFASTLYIVIQQI